ncbi:MAG: type II CRISPR-associated endonuclease Cas1 [Bacteroidaceae bacterium]|nr:type II CRISPR-associated endonuclease Cas1 [Bacteroidaceae bacterium]MEA5100563.1 type II CRISPR-associated endonuclease Cas1 [Bacteroidales bacterium]
MIKRTVYFGSGAYLSVKDSQLVVQLAEDITNTKKTMPIEDIGVVILDNPQITITQRVLVQLLENNVAVITCNQFHHPIGLQLCLDSNTLQSERFQTQINASESLRKNLWQQTIVSKIYNQAMVLKDFDVPIRNMITWSNSVLSGDSKNHEARAAAYYWKNLLESHDNFKRERFGEYPNNFFNYAYAILRAITARSLVASGLLPTLGIHHKNRYNSYCLADDIMEPYRPFADKLIIDIIRKYPQEETLTTQIKQEILKLPIIDVEINKKTSPLQIAMQETTSSLAQCYNSTRRKIKYPIFGTKI